MKQYSNSQLNILVVLRVMIGWHFLYEGVVKLYNSGWTSVGYLNSAEGIFAGVFQAMAANQQVLSLVDNFNVAGQIIIGLGLILGLFANFSAILGIGLLSMYYLAHPPFPGLSTPAGSGNYLIVDRNLIEIITLVLLLVFPSSKFVGLDRLIFRKNKAQKENLVASN